MTALPRPRSLHWLLWQAIALACLPILLLTFLDFRERRAEALNALDNEVASMLMAARLGQEASLRSLQQTFEIMARSDNLRSLDPQDCSGLAQRLLRSMPDFADLGAARPDGQLWCGTELSHANRSTDASAQTWFRDALDGPGITAGALIAAPSSQTPLLVFGYPVYDRKGQLRAVLYAAMGAERFSQLMVRLELPAGWNAFLLGPDGRMLSYWPEESRPARPNIRTVTAFQQAFSQGHATLELPGFDGHRRMYGIAQTGSNKAPLLVAVGAPLTRTIEQIEQGFILRVLLLLTLAVLSMLAARYWVYRLVDAWARRATHTLQELAREQLQARIEQPSPVRELAMVEQGVNHMADELQRHRDELLRLAYFDELTGLHNRAWMYQHMQQALQQQAGTPSPAPQPTSPSPCHAALLLFDVDRFKQVNDTWGHAAGDTLLCHLAQRLQGLATAQAGLARMGSNTFALLVPQLGSDRASTEAAALRLATQALEQLAQPVTLADKQRLYASISSGIALLCGSARTAAQLLKQAEIALYRAEANGGRMALLFDAAMQAEVDERATLEMGLRQALEQQGLLLHYQAQVDARGQVRGAEVLLRWPQGPQGRPVSPAQFIPLAEDTGLIVPIGLWVLDQACAQLARWQTQPSTAALTLSVNVSARQFHQSDFADQVAAALKRHQVQPGGLVLELTESAILGGVQSTASRMQALRALGLRFALDDFGTGYSSLSYLQQLPFDELKIDQSFIRAMLQDPASSAIVRAILMLSRALGLAVVAEGVETASEYDFLLRHDCQGCQGYWFGRPMALTDWEHQHLGIASAGHPTFKQHD